MKKIKFNKRSLLWIAAVTAILLFVVLKLATNKKNNEKELQAGNLKLTAIPVTVDTVHTGVVMDSIRPTGSFEANKQATVFSETQGNITAMSVTEGDYTPAGRRLCYVSAPVNDAQLRLAKTNLDKATGDLKKYEVLVKADAVSRIQYEGIQQAYNAALAAFSQAKSASNNSIVSAPFSGYITKKYVESGSAIMPGMPLFDIADINTVKLVVKLTPEEIQNIKTGQGVAVTTTIFPGEYYTGSISKIGVIADVSKRYDVDISVINKNGKLKPGMYGSVSLDNNRRRFPLLIPREALSGSAQNPEVFVVKGDSVIVATLITEPVSENLISVKKGLSEGDIIVTSGQINLKQGSKIRIVNIQNSML